MLWIAVIAAIAAPDSEAAVDLKSFRSVGDEQLHRNRAFPISAVTHGIHINTGSRLKKVFQIRDKRESRYCQKCVDDLTAITRIIEHLRIHAVIDHLPIFICGIGCGPSWSGSLPIR